MFRSEEERVRIHVFEGGGQYLEVEVRRGGAARGPHGADHLPDSDVLPRVDMDSPKVGVTGMKAVRMTEEDHVTVSAGTPDLDDLALARRKDRVSAPPADFQIDPRMEAAAALAVG